MMNACADFIQFLVQVAASMIGIIAGAYLLQGCQRLKLRWEDRRRRKR